MSTKENKVILDKIDIDDLVKNQESNGIRLIKIFKQKRACVFFIKGYSKICDPALDIAKSFFSLPIQEKEYCHGVRFFSNQEKQANLMQYTFNGRRYQKSLADVFGRERGWIPTRTCNTKVHKEYYQYGLENEVFAEKNKDLIQNIWPQNAFGIQFKKRKMILLDEFVRIHHAIWDAISAVAFKGSQRLLYKWPSNIIVRDTHYLPLKPKQDTDNRIRNKPHVDLSEGTLISYAHGLQIYLGDKSDMKEIQSDESNWYSVSDENLCNNCLIYLPSLALEIRTAGGIQAVWHRVIGTDKLNLEEPRYSIVSFGNAGISDMLEHDLNIPDFEPKNKFPKIRRDFLPLVGNWDYNMYKNSTL